VTVEAAAAVTVGTAAAVTAALTYWHEEGGETWKFIQCWLVIVSSITHSLIGISVIKPNQMIAHT